MHYASCSFPTLSASRRPALFGLAALGLLSLTALPAHAQTQDLFVSNQYDGTISRFAGNGLGTLSTTATTFAKGLGVPLGLAFDPGGDLFVVEYSKSSITEFAAGATPGTFGAGKIVLSGNGLDRPAGLAFNAHGDLFVANTFGNSIIEFAAGTTPGTFGTVTTLQDSVLNGPVGLAFDVRGDLFANSSSNSIIEFAAASTPGTFEKAKITESGTGTTYGLAFDTRGDLFASVSGTNSITEFAAGGSPGTFGTATKLSGGGLYRPAGLAFDARGDLFAADYDNNGAGITEFAAGTTPGTFETGKTFGNGLSGASFLAFSPLPFAPVPEASTTVSFGLLLMLGLGGMVVVAKRKKASVGV